MSDEDQAVGGQIQVVITYDTATGGLNVQSPALQSKMFMYGLLESVRDMLRDHYASADRPNIVVPFPGARIPRQQ